MTSSRLCLVLEVFHISDNERFAPKVSNFVHFAFCQVHLGWPSGSLWHLFEFLQQKQRKNEAPLSQGHQELVDDEKESPISFRRRIEPPPPISVAKSCTGTLLQMECWATLSRGMCWSMCLSYRATSPPVSSQGWVYRVWPPIGLTNSCHDQTVDWGAAGSGLDLPATG